MESDRVVEMEIFRIVTNDRGGDQRIDLKEKGGRRVLPILIGLFEAEAIRLQLTGRRLPRPFTHDLLKNTISELGARVERIVIDELKERTFHAKLVLRTAQGESKRIDSRPSDAIALAVRTSAPIFVSPHVLEITGIQSTGTSETKE